MNVERIATARNTVFALKFPKDSAQGSPTVIGIHPLFGFEETSEVHYQVSFSDGTEVEVKDAVEIWRVPVPVPMVKVEERADETEQEFIPF